MSFLVSEQTERLLLERMRLSDVARQVQDVSQSHQIGGTDNVLSSG